MKKILIAAIASNGVIGRTRKPCPGYPNLDGICEIRECHNGKVYRDGPPGTYGLAVDDCIACGGVGTVPANDLPWGRAYPEDLARFKATTMGYAVAVGRLTAEGMGKVWPLKGRASIEITRRMEPHPNAAVYRARSLDEAIRMVRAYEETDRTVLYIGGGAELFRVALPIADELDLTLIWKAYEGDVLFPFAKAFLRDARVGGYATCIDDRHGGHDSRFDCVSCETCPTNPDLTFTKWVRR